MSESRREFLANMTAAGLSKELLGNTEDREAGAQDNKKQKQETEQNEDLEIEIRDLKEDIESFAETLGRLSEQLIRINIKSGSVIKNKEIDALIKAQDGVSSLSAKRRNNISAREVGLAFDKLATATDIKKSGFNPDGLKNLKELQDLFVVFSEAIGDLKNLDMPKNWSSYDQEVCNESMDEVSKNLQSMSQKIKRRIIKLGGEIE